MIEVPGDMTPEEFDRMIARHVRQLGEHCLGVAIVAIRSEDLGGSGVYYRTAGNSHAAEKAVSDFADRCRIRRETRFKMEAEEELGPMIFGPIEPPDPPQLPGDEWKDPQ